jgi:hypothetical protein
MIWTGYPPYLKIAASVLRVSRWGRRWYGRELGSPGVSLALTKGRALCSESPEARTLVCMFTGLNSFLERRAIIITKKTLGAEPIRWYRLGPGFSHVG